MVTHHCSQGRHENIECCTDAHYQLPLITDRCKIGRTTVYRMHAYSANYPKLTSPKWAKMVTVTHLCTMTMTQFSIYLLSCQW